MWTCKRLGWTIYSVLQYQLFISEINSCKGIFYSPLSVELINPIKRLNNNQNKDKKITNALDSIQPDT